MYSGNILYSTAFPKLTLNCHMYSLAFTSPITVKVSPILLPSVTYVTLANPGIRFLSICVYVYNSVCELGLYLSERVNLILHPLSVKPLTSL